MLELEILGRLGKDPETRTTQSGQNVTSFTVADSRKVKDQEVTTWVRVSAWGKMGEVCAKYLKKGRQVLVKGYPSASAYTNKDGKAVGTLEVNARQVDFVGGGKQDTADPPKYTDVTNDDDLPFG